MLGRRGVVGGALVAVALAGSMLGAGVSGATTYIQSSGVLHVQGDSIGAQIDDSGDVSGTINATGTSKLGTPAATFNFTGTIAPGSGVGTSKAVFTTTTTSSGFSGSFTTKGHAAISGTYTGSFTLNGNPIASGTTVTWKLSCTATYPPLAFVCAAAGQVSSYK